MSTIYANDSASESNYHAGTSATSNRRVSTTTTVEDSPPRIGSGAFSHGAFGQQPPYEYTPSPPPSTSRALASSNSAGLAAAASTGSIAATNSSNPGSTKKKRSRRPNAKPVSLGQVPPGGVAAADTASAAAIIRCSSSGGSPAPDGSQRSLEDAPATHSPAGTPSVLSDKYASAQIGFIADAVGNQDTSSAAAPAPAKISSRKKKLTLIGPDAGVSSSHEQEGGHSSSQHHYKVKQEERSMPAAEADDTWGKLGSGVGAGQGADEAAEELERLTDGESHPSPTKSKSTTVDAAYQLERSASYQNGFAVTEPPAPLPPKKRKRGGADGSSSAPKAPRKRRGAATASAAAAAAYLEGAELSEPNTKGSDHPIVEEPISTEFANGSLEQEGGGMAEPLNNSAANKKGEAAKISEPVVLARRLIQLEDLQRKVWVNLARRDIPRVSSRHLKPSYDDQVLTFSFVKVYRMVSSGFAHKVTHHKKLSSMIMSNARRATTRTSKLAKDNQIKARRITREMLLYWKRNEKEEGVSRRRAEKEALDKVKAEEERKEAVRHAKKLEFLLTQTELFSHFVGSKLKSKCMEHLLQHGVAYIENVLQPPSWRKTLLLPKRFLRFRHLRRQ